MTCLVLLLAGAALAGDPQDLRESIENGAVINWTSMRVEVTSSATPSGVDSSRKVVETSARRPIGDKMRRAVGTVLVQGEQTVQELRTDPEIGQKIARRETHWAVTESRYFTSGRIELHGELKIGEVLKPWLLDQASTAAPVDVPQGRHTGVVVLARGLNVQRAFAPRILASDGETVLHDGLVWKDSATNAIPVIYVPDPAHPAAAFRAGKVPLIVSAMEVRGADVVLTRESSIEYRTGLKGSRAVGQGTVVIVVDP